MLLPLCASLALAAPPAEKPIKPLPTLSKEPKLDGSPKDLAQAVEFKLPESAEGSSAKLTKLKAAFRKDTLYVSVNVDDDKYVASDHLDVTLFFPESGTTSRGVVYRFTNEGLQPAPADIGAPEFAQALVKTNLSATPTGYAVLSLVATLGTTTPSEVAARIGAKPSTLTAHLAGLETDGLISRRRGADGRSADLQITEQGRRAHGDAHRRVELVWRSVSGELDVPELRAVLARLITSLTERARPLR